MKFHIKRQINETLNYIFQTSDPLETVVYTTDHEIAILFIFILKFIIVIASTEAYTFVSALFLQGIRRILFH